MTHRAPSAPDRLLASALVEFAHHHKAGARTSRIAARAGVNKQLIQYYFRGKDGLYQAVLARAAAETGAAMSRVPLVGLTAVERLRRLVRGQFDFLAEHANHTALLASAESGGAWADQAIRPILELLTEGQATGFFRDDVDPLQHARLALIINLGFFALRGLTDRWSSHAQWRDRTADLIVRGCTW